VVATPAVKVTVVAESVLKGGRPAKRKAAELVEDAEEADTAVEVEAIKPAITKKGKKEPVERQVPIKETLVAKATEPKVALLEAPLVIEGKRTRRSVQTLDLNPPMEAKEPPKKAAKKIAAVSKAVVAAVVALSKKESPAKKKSAAAKRGKKSKEIESEQEEEDDDECMDDDAEKEAEENLEPSEEEIRKTIEGIIDGANLDNITMKTVVKDVHAKYPGVDLTNKKNFIKGVVKELLSD
jgi:protein DEK